MSIGGVARPGYAAACFTEGGSVAGGVADVQLAPEDGGVEIGHTVRADSLRWLDSLRLSPWQPACAVPSFTGCIAWAPLGFPSGST